MSRFVTYPKPGASGTIRRFEPAYWTVNFPISMMATVITTGPNSLRVKALFRRAGDLMGLIWEVEDRDSAGTFAYPRRKDFRGCVLQFDWQSSGVRALDEAQGPNLVVETYAGATFNIRLWNYAISGTPDNCRIRMVFDETTQGGFAPEIPIPWDDVKRMFISLVPDAYIEGSLAPIGESAAQVDLTNITVSGPNSTLPMRTEPLPAHELRMTDGYDNAYPFSPERLVDQCHALGYRGPYVLYMGISKFHSLSWNASEERYIVDPAKPRLNAPSVQWLEDFFARLHAKGYTIIISVSFEILGMFMPDSWNQRDFLGRVARTGWEPPSGLIRPTSDEGLTYLANVFLDTLALLPAGAQKHFQIGEPWWWDGSYGEDPAPHIYDFGTLTAYNAATGQFAPEPRLQTVFGQPDPVHQPYLDWLRDQLGVATNRLRDDVLAVHPGATSYLLVFTPQILRSDAPMLYTLNFPKAAWAHPAFDVLQIEDYDKIVEGDYAFNNLTWELATTILNYPLDQIDYFAGFTLLPDATWIWYNTDKAIWLAFQRAPREVYVWSREQVMRDGWLWDKQSWKVYPAVTRLAQCWRITRTDGTVMAFTSFDRPLTVDGITYKPANSFSASQFASDTDMSVADVELLGALDADDIRAADLLAGIYDHAEVELFLVDWGDLTLPRTIVRRGWIGTIGQAGGAFRAELRGLGQRIQQPVIDSYSAECRVDLYSPQCGVNRAAFAVPATVTALTDGSLGAASDNRIFFAAALNQPAGWFDYGEIWWTSGNNAGRKTEVRSFAAGRIELWEPMGLDIAVGDTFTIHAGCDKAIGTCRDKFSNVVNFRGEPHVPGTDAMLRYPDPK